MLDVITDNLDIWTTAQKQKKAVGRGRAKKEQGYGIKKLRELILELAVRGKLVPQDPNDEPASELLDQSLKAKSKIAESRKLRKDKQTYEVTDLFDVPTLWEWACVGVFCHVLGGKRVPRGYSLLDAQTDHVYIRVTDMKNQTVLKENLKYIDEDIYTQISKYIINKEDVYVTIAGTIGAVGSVPYDLDGMNLTENASKLIFRYIDKDFIIITLSSNYVQSQFSEAVNQLAQPKLSLTSIKETSIAIPPLAEQHRIVAKVDELMALCDQLEQEQADHQATHQTLVKTLLNGLIETATLRPIDPSTSSELTAQGEQASTQHTHPESTEGKPPEAQTTADYFNQLIAQHFDTLFTTEDSIDQLKQTILQLAVMGKLVPQNPKDEPASVLLEKIAQEKNKLIKEGKIKKQKALPEITEDEKPFGLPDGWEWVRLPEIGELARGKSKHRPRNAPFLYDGGTIPLVQTGDVARADPLVLTYTAKYNQVGLEQSRLWHTGTLCITIAANIADTGILSFDACFPDSVVGFNCFETDMNVAYFDYFIRTAKNHLEDYAPSTAQKNINLAILGSLLVPLPPLNELNRIATKVNQLLSLCDTLKANLNQAQTTQTQLADTIVKQAVN